MSDGIITIKKGREKPIRNQHPWVFSGAVDRAENAVNGELVTILDHRGNFLARGYWNTKSQIQARILTWQEDEAITDEWWQTMLQRAVSLRYPKPQHNVANRIIHAESDYIPGLIVDRYGEYLVLQALTLFIDINKQAIAQKLMDVFADAGMPIKGVYERSDVDVRKHEGLEETQGFLIGEEPPEQIEFEHGKIKYQVDVRVGHKTGFYLDQMQNFDLVGTLTTSRGLNSPEHTLLNTFSYTGSFGLQSVAHVTNVDSSFEALTLAEKTYQLNDVAEDSVEFIQADVFDYLYDCVAENRQYDIVILDPPKFAHNKRQVDRASRGYKNLNLNAFKIIKEGGYLLTFSCSGAISQDLFQKIVFGALADSGRQAQIIQHLSANSDHPVALTFPEGEYLKGLLLRVY